MNLTALLNFESMAYKGAQTQSSAVNTFVANSLLNVIQNFFMQIAPSFIVIISCRRASPWNFYKNIMEHLYRTVDNMVIQLINISYEEPQHIEGPRMYNLMLVDSFEAFLDIDIVSYTASHDTNEYYYIFLQQRDKSIPQDMQAIFEYCWNYQLINCNVQIQNSVGEVQVFSYFPYTVEHCDHVKPVLINKFMGTGWQNVDYFPKKLKNFYRCPLQAAVREIPPFLQRRGMRLSGLEGNLLQQLSHMLNFSLQIVVPEDADNYAQRTGSTNTGSTALLADRIVQMSAGYYRKRHTENHLTTSTFPHHQSTVVASIWLNAHNLTTYQVLTFSFQFYSWMAILVSFVSFTLALSALHQLHHTLCRQWNKKPSVLFPLLATLLGMPLVVPPNTSPERLMHIAWMLTTFVVRSIYSALLYHLYRNVVHQSLPTELFELLDLDYTAVMNRFTLNDILAVPYFDQFRGMRSIILNSTDEAVPFPYLEAHSRENMFAVTSRDFLVHYAHIHHRPGMFKVLPEIVMNQQLTLQLAKHSYLIQEFDECIMAIQAVGLLDIWTRWELSDKYFKSSHLMNERLIGLHELSGLYVIMGGIYIIAALVFILELLSKRIRILERLFS